MSLLWGLAQCIWVVGAGILESGSELGSIITTFRFEPETVITQAVSSVFSGSSNQTSKTRYWAPQ